MNAQKQFECYISEIEELAEKIRNTLLYCADVSRKRTGLNITQKEVVMT